MADVPRYWTTEFIEAFVEAINDDDDFQQTARKFSDTIVFRCLDTPDGKDIEAAYEFDEGEIVSVEIWEEDAPSDDLRGEPFDKKTAMARATAPYPVWVKLDKGEMNALQALTSPDYNVEGPKLKIMANMGVLNGMGDVASKVTKTY
ncbi:MAG: hypothetical protein AAGG50_18925 [Bacteroidota bacterium]